MGELTINTVVFIVLLHFNTVMSCECLTDSLCIFPGCVSLSIINLPHNNLFFTDKKKILRECSACLLRPKHGS